MPRPLSAVAAVVAVAAISAASTADIVEVRVEGVVYANYGSPGGLYRVQVGAPASMSYRVDSNDFVTDPAVPARRSYWVDPEQFTTIVGGVDVNLEPDSAPTYLVVEYDPDGFDKLRLAMDLEWGYDPVVDLVGQFGYHLDMPNAFWLKNGVIPSQDISEAGGVYGDAQFVTAVWGFDDVLVSLVQIEVASLVIENLDHPACPADTDGDGDVDVTDLNSVIVQWGTAGSADITADGVVDVDDLVAVIAAWGDC